MTGSLWAFFGISILVIVSPGPDTALTIRNALVGGRNGGLATAGGVAIGQTIWAFATSIGLAALLVASEAAFLAVKLVGAAYLIFVGAQAVYRAIRPDRSASINGVIAPAARLRPTAAFRQGVINDLGNPKMAAFFTSLLPQFAPAGGASFMTLLLLGCIFALMTFVWLAAYAVVVATAGDFLRRGVIRRLLDAFMGSVLIALGLRIASESRP